MHADGSVGLAVRAIGTQAHNACVCSSFICAALAAPWRNQYHMQVCNPHTKIAGSHSGAEIM